MLAYEQLFQNVYSVNVNEIELLFGYLIQRLCYTSPRFFWLGVPLKYVCVFLKTSVATFFWSMLLAEKAPKLCEVLKHELENNWKHTEKLTKTLEGKNLHIIFLGYFIRTYTIFSKAKFCNLVFHLKIK